MRVGRLVPLLILMVAVGVVVQRGLPAARALVDFTKVSVTRFEVAQIMQQLQADAALGQAPRPEDADALVVYLRNSAQNATGRDPSMDRWGHPYRLELRDDNTLVLLSMGPNGVPDQCAGTPSAGPDDDDVCVWTGYVK
jgi:hypothetical protein